MRALAASYTSLKLPAPPTARYWHWSLAVAIHLALFVMVLPSQPNRLPIPLQATLRLLTPASPMPVAPVSHNTLPTNTPRSRLSGESVARSAMPATTNTPVLAVAANTGDTPPTHIPAAPSPTAPPTMIAARFDADYLHNPKPAYPVLSRRQNEEGKVLLHVRVSPQGAALEVGIKQSSGFPRLDNAARETVTGWRFVPARRGEEAFESWVTVPISFVLD